MKQRLLLILIAAVAMFSADANSIMQADNAPDFAYPQTVMADASQQLAQALRNNDGDAIVNSVINYGLAKTAIDVDSLPLVIARIDSVASLRISPATASLLHLLKAKALADYYSDNSYDLNRRTTTGTLPADISLWNGNQLKNVIMSECRLSLTDPEALKAVSVTSYPLSIVCDKTVRPLYPTLFDFVSYRTSRLLCSVSDSASLFPVEALTNPVTPTPPGTPSAIAQAIDIVNSWVSANLRPTPARIAALLSRVNIINSYPRYSFSDATPETALNQVLALYDENEATPYAIELLIDFQTYDIPENAVRTYYTVLKQFADSNPSYVRINSVKNILSSIENRSIRISGPATVFPGTNAQFTVKANNTRKLSLRVRRVPQSLKTENYIRKSQVTRCPVVQTVELEFHDTIPFTATKTFDVCVSDFGRYIIESDLNASNYFPMFCCTELYPFTSSSNPTAAYVVDAYTGAPVNGVTVTARQHFRDKDETSVKVTDSDGKALFTFSDRYRFRPTEFSYIKGDDKFAPPLDASIENYNTEKDDFERNTADVYFSLPVYHPGDTIDFVAVVFNSKHTGDTTLARPLQGKKVSVALNDVNGIEVDSMSIHTDAFGRISGRLKVPESGITGNYSVLIRDESGLIGSNYIMVSDYKLPTYTVSIETALTDNRISAITGKATTFSGMPVAGAVVSVKLNNSRPFFFYGNNTQTDIFVKETVTDADGSFSVDVTDTELSACPWPQGIFTASATVTSATGETEAAQTVFTDSKELSVYCSEIRSVDITRPCELAITVHNAKGESVAVPLSITVSNTTDSVVLNAESTLCNKTAVDFGALTPGRYDISIEAVGFPQTAWSQSGVVIYNPAAKESPVSDTVWTYMTQLSISADARKAEIPVWAAADNTPVLVSTGSPMRIDSERWVTLHKGRNVIKVNLSSDADEFNINILSVRNFRMTDLTVKLNRSLPSKNIRISVENFRDHLISDTDESLTVRITPESGSTESYPVILGIYNKALDKIVASRWSFSNPVNYRDFYRYIFAHPQFSNYTIERVQKLSEISFNMPSLNLHDMSFGSGSRIFYYETAMPRSAVSMKSAPGNIVNSVNDNSVDSVEEEYAVEAEETDGGATPNKKTTETFRPAEVPLMLFAPALTTRPDGTLEVAFHVSDANSTWVMNILSYSSEMFGVVDTRNFITSKPVMVTPNRPRFLRHGDEMTLISTAFNNTDSTALINTSVEILNPADRSVIASFTDTLEIQPGGSATFSTPVTTQNGLPLLLVRVKASDGSYSDGEQFLIPVLASEQRVTESEVFYLNPTEDKYSTEIKSGKDTDITLTFCENPAWEVATALPGLSKDGTSTATSTAQALYSVAVADGLMRSYPTMADAINNWLSTSDVKSLLESNEEFKQFMLTSTPWVSNATSDTERMQRLALLFNKKEVSKSISSYISRLSELKTSEGGWCWSSYFDSTSKWATSSVLCQLAMLKNLGYLPDNRNLDEMITDGIAYLDREAAKAYTLHKTATPISLAYIHSCFPDIQPASTAAAQALNKCISNLVGSWKKSSTTGKAESAIVLEKSKYPSVAREILNSLNQFAVSSPDGGMWWPSADRSFLSSSTATSMILNAYALINPDAPEIDRIRQYLIINKQLQDWGSGISATYCVNAILQSGSDWLSLPGNTRICVDGSEIPLSQSDCLTGAVVAQLPIEGAHRITITRTGNGPAWGSIMQTSTRPMTEIADASMPEISISKEILSGSGDNWNVTDSLRLGETVKVRLIIKTTRDMDYLTVSDSRAACLEPVIQTPRPIYCDGAVFYLENRDASTNLFIDTLRRGTYILEYEMRVNNSGSYTSGIATVQSQYAPEFTAHSAGTVYTVEK